MKKYTLIFLLALCITLLSIWSFLTFVSMDAILHLISNVNKSLLGLSLLVYISIVVLRAIRFSIVSDIKNTVDNIVIVCIHTFFGNILPAKIGEAAYPLVLKKVHAVGYKSSIADLLAVRYMDCITIGLFILASIGLFVVKIPFTIVLILYMLGSWIGIALFKWFVGRYTQQKIKYREAVWRIWTVSWVISVLMFAYSTVLMNALGIKASFIVIVVGSSLSLLSSLLPVQGLFGFGTTEAGWVGTLIYAGASRAESISASVGYHILTLVFSTTLFLGASIYLLVVFNTKTLANSSE